METINEPTAMSFFWALLITTVFICITALMAWAIFTAPEKEFDEGESINELNEN
jgi:hypothetical protein